MSIGKKEQRREIIDWFHLKENLYKVGGSIKGLRKAEALLWKDIRNSKTGNIYRSQAQKFAANS